MKKSDKQQNLLPEINQATDFQQKQQQKQQIGGSFFINKQPPPSSHQQLNFKKQPTQTYFLFPSRGYAHTGVRISGLKLSTFGASQDKSAFHPTPEVSIPIDKCPNSPFSWHILLDDCLVEQALFSAGLPLFILSFRLFRWLIETLIAWPLSALFDQGICSTKCVRDQEVMCSYRFWNIVGQQKKQTKQERPWIRPLNITTNTTTLARGASNLDEFGKDTTNVQQ